MAKLLQVVALCSAVVAIPAIAGQPEGAGKEQFVRLNCPNGTLQKGGKVTKDYGVFCAKTGAQSGREAVLHGPYVDFWANGQKQSEGQYRDGFRTGRWTFWDANGVKTGETEFAGGNYHGTRIEYHANGNKKLVQSWANGKKEGSEVGYSVDGQKVYQAEFRDGHAVSEQRLENGRSVAK